MIVNGSTLGERWPFLLLIMLIMYAAPAALDAKQELVVIGRRRLQPLLLGRDWTRSPTSSSTTRWGWWPPTRPASRHVNRTLPSRSEIGLSGAKSTAGDIPLADDRQRWRAAWGERADVHRAYLIEQCCDVSQPSAELLNERGPAEG